MKRLFWFSTGRKARTCAPVLILAAAIVTPAIADTYDWNGSTTGGGTGASNNWNTADANWTGFGPTWPAISTGNDDAVFAGTAGTVTLTTAITANDLTFNTNNYIVTGNALTFDGASPTISVVPATATINSALAGAAFTKSGTGTLVLGGNNAAYGSGFTVSQGKVQMATGANSAFGTGPINLGDANTGSNPIGLSFNGLTATTTIGNVTVNNFGTGTTIYGTVNAANNNQMPTFGLTLNKAVTLTVGESTGGNNSDLNMSSISGSGAGAGNDTLIIDAYNTANRILRTSITDAGTASTFTGNVLVQRGIWNMQNRSYVANTAANQNLIIPDTSSVTVNSGATWNLVWGVETIDALNGAGNVTYNGGTSFLATDPHLTVGGGNGSGTFSGTMTAAGFRFGKIGSGVQTLSGNNTYSGTTTVNGGTLRAGSTTGLSANSAFTLANATGTVLDLKSFNNTIGSLAGGGATGGNVTLGTATLTTGGNNSSTSYAGVISGNGGVIKMGTGSWTISGNNTFTGGMTIGHGTLLLGNAGALNSTTPNSVTLGVSGATGPTLDVNGQSFNMASLTVAANVTNATVRTNTWGGPYVTGLTTLNSPLRIFRYDNNIHTGFQTGGKITGNGGGSGNVSLTFERTGSNNFYWQNNQAVANDFLGNVRVVGGELRVQGGNIANVVIPDTAMVIIESGASFSWNNFSAAVTETIDGLAGGGTMFKNLPNYTITINANNPDNEGDRVFTGSLNSMLGNLTFGGIGTQEFSGANPSFANQSNLNNGTLKLTNTTAWNSNVVFGGSNTPKLQLNAPGMGDTWTFAKLISGGSANADVEKIGAGKVTVNQNNTYSGTTTVTNGTLLVNGSHTGGAGYTVAGGATLGGTGSTASTLNVTGTLSPGASIESFASGALTMNSGSTFVFEADSSDPNLADLMAVNGALSLTNVDLDLTSADLAAGTWLVGDKLTLISYNTNSITSGFVNYDNDEIYTFGTNQWLFKYNDSFAGNNYKTQAEDTGTQFVTMTLVPEPGSLAMLAFGILSLWLFRKRN